MAPTPKKLTQAEALEMIRSEVTLLVNVADELRHQTLNTKCQRCTYDLQLAIRGLMVAVDGLEKLQQFSG